MKRIIFFLCALFSFFNLSAQTSNQKSFIGISIGPSFPIGDFANNNITDENSGFATTGGFLKLNYGYKLSDDFGVVAILSGSIYGVDSEKLKNSFAVPHNSGGSISFKATKWKTATLMAGVFKGFSLNKSKNLVLEVKGALGVQRSQSPSLEINIFIPNMTNYNNEQGSASATSFAYLLGLGLNYGLGNNLTLKLHGDYNGANPKYHDISVSSYPANTTIISKQNINTIDVGVGLALSF